jgi:serine/threonine protein kinase
LEFDPEDWTQISDEVKHLITMMLQKEPKNRISIVDSLNHPWFSIIHSEKHDLQD